MQDGTAQGGADPAGHPERDGAWHQPGHLPGRGRTLYGSGPAPYSRLSGPGLFINLSGAVEVKNY